MLTWGKPLSVSDTMAATLGTLNPLRYRGYVYDTETELYYLQSRYYDPNICRFINADGYASTGQGLTGNNMFAYCGNNPVTRIDPTGCWFEYIWDFLCSLVSETSSAMASSSSSYAALMGASAFDGPLPFVDTLAFTGVLFLGAYNIIQGTSRAIQGQSNSVAKAEEKAEVIVDTPSPPTVIYRYGGTNPSNLTPKEKDLLTGLSFSTVPRPNSAVTTIEALNATGYVYAVRDGETHVSVRPIGGTVKDWIIAGPTSIWTQAVKSVVVKWDGVS